MSTDGKDPETQDERPITVGMLIALFGIVVIVAPFALIFWAYAANIAFYFETQPNPNSLAETVVRKFHVFFGLPAAATFSLLLVSILRQTSGPIEFKGLGFEFKGASGQVVLWLMCFMGMSAAVKMLW